MEQIQSRASRLHAAGEIHRFHRDVGELRARAGDLRAALPPAPRDARAAAAALRAHAALRHHLLALDAQVQVLQEEGSRLQKLYPGDNVTQIALQQRALADAWSMLQEASDETERSLKQHLELHQFLSEVRPSCYF